MWGQLGMEGLLDILEVVKNYTCNLEEADMRVWLLKYSLGTNKLLFSPDTGVLA